MAVVPVRAGRLPPGGDEAVAEAGGRGLLVGEGCCEAAATLAGASPLLLVEMGDFAPAAWAAALEPLVEAEDVVLLPATPDGRDLAPRLAHRLGRPLLAGAVLAAPPVVVVTRAGGWVAHEHHLDGPAVVTLQPGCRGVEPRPAGAAMAGVEAEMDVEAVEVRDLLAAGDGPSGAGAGAGAQADAEVLGVSPPDPATMDLAEAPRILAGGGGLGGAGGRTGAGAFRLLAEVAAALGATPGATRVATDAGWMPARAQIGTTGVSVAPRLYVAIGISGAIQHVAGLGRPDHVVAVNVDPSCPMMAMADLALVSDGPAVLAELAARLGVGHPERA